MAGTFLRRPFSASTDGRGVKVVATGTPGTTIHTAQASATLVDVVTVFAYNSDTVAQALTLEWGGVTAPDDNIATNLLPGGAGGLQPVVVDLLLRGGLILKAFYPTASKVVLFGFVNTES